MAHLSSILRNRIVSIRRSILKFRYLVRPKYCLLRDAEAGAPLATLFAQVVLFAASLCLLKTRLCSEYDHSGIKTAILYHICSVLLCYTNLWSRLRFFRRRCSVKVNSMANLICFILGILLEKFYEKSLASLCFALTMAILFLILVMIIRPRTDLGFFGFLLGATGSVAYNLFQLKLGTWIVVAICSVLWAFKCWLDQNWLELELEVQEHDNNSLLPRYQTKRNESSLSNPFPGPVIQSIDALILAGFCLVWASAFLSTNCLNSESCASCSAMEMLKCGAIYGLWVSPAHIHRVYSLFQVELWLLWPNTMPYTKAILQMECIRINIRKGKERRLPRYRNVEHFICEVKQTMEHLFRSGRLCSPVAMEQLPKWLRKKIENKKSETERDIKAFEKYVLDTMENRFTRKEISYSIPLFSDRDSWNKISYSIPLFSNRDSGNNISYSTPRFSDRNSWFSMNPLSWVSNNVLKTGLDQLIELVEPASGVINGSGECLEPIKKLKHLKPTEPFRPIKIVKPFNSTV